MRVGALNPERTEAISIEVAALDCLVIAVGYAIIPLREGLSWDGVVWSSHLMLAMRERTLVAEVATVGGHEQLAERGFEFLV